MLPIDFLVLALAAVSLFYLPFLGAQFLSWLVIDRRRGNPNASATAVLVVSEARTEQMLSVQPESAICPRSAAPVPDVYGLIEYLSEQRATEAEALLTGLLQSR
jgi:hypothetical protein